MINLDHMTTYLEEEHHYIKNTDLNGLLELQRKNAPLLNEFMQTNWQEHCTQNSHNQERLQKIHELARRNTLLLNSAMNAIKTSIHHLKNAQDTHATGIYRP